MICLSWEIALLALASLHLAHGLTATILADTNRDGVVDVTGTSDVAGRHTWTNERGALFLPNIGDTDSRCAQQPGFSEETLHLCNDASDNVLRQAKYLAPLRTLPALDVTPSHIGRIKVANSTVATRVRIFVKQNGQWTYVDENYQFTSTQLEAGLELGIDARDVRKPDWNGKATVEFTITGGGTSSTDSVELRVAPYLTHDPTQLAQRLFAARPGTRDQTAQFNADLATHNTALGFPPLTFITGADRWVQDQFEAGYASIPGPTGPVVIRLMLLSYQRRYGPHRSVYELVRNGDVGGVSFPEPYAYPFQQDKWGTTHDSTGNMETVPPHTHNGKTWPAGRVIVGEGEARPLIIDFLQAQEVQSPIVLDTTWLHVGHVDEFLHFLPANNARGWVVVADDPLAGLALLRNASAAGHGGRRALSRPTLPSDSASNCVPKSTIDWELARTELTRVNQYAAERILYNLNILKTEAGITDNEIVRVPGLYWTEHWTCGNSNTASRVANTVDDNDEPLDIFQAAEPALVAPAALKRRQTAVPQAAAHYPSAVNGVVLSNSYYLAPNPWGPVIDGKDILAEAINAAYAQVGYTVHYIDDWFSHHQGFGEVHCGTNVWRETNRIWWT
ncbi:hypothetical protein S40293_09092 [Stachybotrys chartarum IBT 40293]|nr:hypothetical protein S40293_09092 [Stachybotrys chartarum IBT 40293]KFA79451.1 hypothetical protein S40288_07589 [Stachybotrys chartarum IBT 40288]